MHFEQSPRCSHSQSTEPESRALSRRRMLQLGLLGGVFGGVLLRRKNAEAQTKVSQTQAHYQSTPNSGKDCDDCKYFLKPHSCQLVNGEINPHGWCQFWTKKA